MKLMVKLHGEPLQAVSTLVEGYMVIHDEFKKRWPTDFYGPQEAAAHGLTLEGTPEYTPEQARELRKAHREEQKQIGPSIRERMRLALALRKGRLQ